MHRPLLAYAAALLAPALAAAQHPHVPPTSFTVRIENVSTPATLKLSNGMTAPAPTAPVLWVLHTSDDPIFTTGQPDRGEGLEALSEDGNPGPLTEALTGRAAIAAAGFVNTPAGADAPGPILPGHAYEVRFDARPGQRLTLAFMFGQSNDVFFAPEGRGIELFDAMGRPRGGDLTGELVLWDAGTEVNQEPGLGPDQAPRQAAPNTGADERGTVRHLSDAFAYPRVNQVVRVMLAPTRAAMSAM